MIIDEIRNSKFNFQLNIITTLIFGNQCCLFQELTVGPLLSLSFPSTMIYKNQTGKRQNENTQKEQTIHPENGSNYFRFGIFEDNFFLISELNSFQQPEMSNPFSRFIILLEICFPGFRLSMYKTSLIFLHLQCVSESRKIVFSQSIWCFVFVTCCAIPLVWVFFLTAYWC